MTVNEQALAAFAELQEAAQMVGKEFKLDWGAILTVIDVRMEIYASCDYSITAEYEIWLYERMFSSGTASYDSLLGMIGYEGK